MPASLPLKRILQALARIENAVLIALLGLMVLLAGGQIILRNLLDFSILGIDPFLRMLVLWVALLGAVAASRENRHISIDLFSRLLSPRALARVRIVTEAFTVTVCVLLAWHAARFVASERESGDMLTALIPMWVAQLILPLAFALIALRYLLLFSQHTLEAVMGRNPGP